MTTKKDLEVHLSYLNRVYQYHKNETDKISEQIYATRDKIIELAERE